VELELCRFCLIGIFGVSLELCQDPEREPLDKIEALFQAGCPSSQRVNSEAIEGKRLALELKKINFSRLKARFKECENKKGRFWNQ